VTYRYSSISNRDGDFDDDIEKNLTSGTSLYDDSEDDDDLVDPTSPHKREPAPPAPSNPGPATAADITLPPKVKSFHDDSDDVSFYFLLPIFNSINMGGI
jgi:hypothetical protein